MTQGQAAGFFYFIGRTGILGCPLRDRPEYRSENTADFPYVICHFSFSIAGIHHAWRTMANEN